MRRKRDTIKLLAIHATELKFAATKLSDRTNSKEQETLNEEKVNEALAKHDKEENEDEEES